MARVLITLKIMPKNLKVDLSKLEEEVFKKIEEFGGNIGKSNQEDVAFGLKAVIISFFSDETKSNLDPLEESIQKMKNVESVSIIEVRRALG